MFVKLIFALLLLSGCGSAEPPIEAVDCNPIRLNVETKPIRN
jgi:hypothetical protein